MRFAIFGDIHANFEAFEAVLADAKREKCDRFICLGDVVGYNADPQPCLAIVKELGCPVVKGNHDEYASSLCSLETFNPLAESAIRWTRETLTPGEKEFLSSFPLTADVESFTIVHATRSEEHTSELQSRQYLVCRLLLEKKKTITIEKDNDIILRPFY